MKTMKNMESLKSDDDVRNKMIVSSTSKAIIITQKNPLLLPVVVSNIVELLKPDLATFRNFRLVCKTWHYATLCKWRKEAVLKIVPDANNFSAQIYEGLYFSSFVQEYKNPTNLPKLAEMPFCKYRLQGFVIDVKSCVELDGPALDFWNDVGPQIKYLHLENCKFSKCNANGLLELLQQKVRNLNDLVLTHVKVVVVHAKFGKTVVMKKSGSHENLKTLTLYGLNKMHLQDLLEFAPNLQVIYYL